jgi:hypothetical protein
MDKTIRPNLFRLITLLTIVLIIGLAGQGVYAQDGKGKDKLSFNPNPITEISSDAETITLGEQSELDSPDPSLTTKVITQSTNTGTIVAGTSIACGNGQVTRSNSWWRAFDLSTYGITSQFTVTKVRFAVEDLNAGDPANTMPITIRIYKQTGAAFPSGTRTLIGTAHTVNLSDGINYFVDVFLTRTVPAGSDLVVEIFSQDVGGAFYVGMNDRGQTRPTYVSASACEVNSPTSLSALGFSSSHMILVVTGDKADNVSASASCVNSRNLRVQISGGDANFNITGSGPGLPRNNVGPGVYTFTGPGTWNNVKVTELKGDKQTVNVGSFTCIPTPTPTPTPSHTPTHTTTDTPTETLTPSETLTPTETLTPSDTPTGTLSDTPTATNTDTPSDTPTHTLSPTPTNTLTDTPMGCQIFASTPTLISPVHRAHTTDTTPTFAWSSVTGAQSYRLMVYLEDRSFEYKKRVFNSSYTLSAGEALSPAKYLWRARTQDSTCGTWTAWSGRNTLFVD